MRLLAGLLLLCVVPAAGHAQLVRGAVRAESDSLAIASALVKLVDDEGVVRDSTLTDSLGNFILSPKNEGRYMINASHLAFRSMARPIDLERGYELTVVLTMAANAIALEPLIVTARRQVPLEYSGFYRRSRSGAGRFITRDDIERRRPIRTTDLFHVVPRVQLLAVTGDDQQGVVDAHAEADHQADELRHLGHREHVAQRDQDRGADADAHQRGADGQAHGEHRPEGQDQDDDGERHAQDLGRRLLELGEDPATRLDAQSLDVVGGGREHGVADLTGPGEVDVLGQFDLGEGDLARGRALRRDLPLALRAVRTDDAVDVGELGGLVEHGLHAALDLGVGHALGSFEDDRAGDAGTGAAEVLVEDVEAVARLGVGQVELVSEGVARPLCRTAYEEQYDPEPEYELPAVVAPGA